MSGRNSNHDIAMLLSAMLLAATGCKEKNDDYRVNKNDKSNFAVFMSFLYPDEHLTIRLNGKLLMEQTGEKITGAPTNYTFYYFPDTVKSISIKADYKGKITMKRDFVDTLVNSPEKRITISRPHPKGMTKYNYKPYSYVPIEKSERTITLSDTIDRYNDVINK